MFPDTVKLLCSAALLAAVIAVPKDSKACSCIAPGEQFAAPTDAQNQTVPTNTRIWVHGWYNATLELLDENGERVPGTLARMSSNSGMVLVFTPATELIMGQRYTYETVNGAHGFLVNAPADHTPPAVPKETAKEAYSEDPDFDFFGLGGESSSCGDGGYYGVSVTLEEEGMLNLIDAAGSTLDGLADGAKVTAFGYDDQSVFLGTGTCASSWPEAESGHEASFRYSTFDLAGNFSGWSEPSLVEIPGGCSCVRAPRTIPAGALLLIAFGALALRATSRRRTH